MRATIPAAAGASNMKGNVWGTLKDLRQEEIGDDFNDDGQEDDKKHRPAGFFEAG